MVTVESRLSSLCFVPFVVGMLLLVVSVQWVAAGGPASTTELVPPLLDKRDRGTLELPGGLDPMEVVRMVEENRVGMGGNHSESEPGFNSFVGLCGGARDERDYFGRDLACGSLPFSVAGETQPVGRPAPAAEGVGPTFPIGGDPIYGPAANDQIYPAIAFDGTNYLVVWEDSRSGTYHDIYGARVNGSGVVLDTFGLLISDGTFDEHSPAIAFDGTNYLVVWEQEPSYGHTSYDIYGARVSADGSVLDRHAISTADNWQRWPAIAFDGTNYLVAWMDSRSGSYDIYGARVSAGGSVLDPAGIAISTAANDQELPAVAFDGTNYLVVWDDQRSGTFDIYGSRVSTGGSVLDPAGKAISAAVATQRYPAIAFDGTNCLVVWEDERSGTYDIYGSRVSAGGSVLDPAGIAIFTSAGNKRTPQVAFDGTNYLVVWDDYAGGSFDIYGARVSTGGSVLDPGGIAISTAVSIQGWPAIAFDGTNYLVVWRDNRNAALSSLDIYGSRVSTGGTVLDPAGIAISTWVNSQRKPAVAFDGTNYLVVWEDNRNRSSYIGVYGARVSASGTVLDPTGIAICIVTNAAAYWDDVGPAVAFGGTNYLVAWTDNRGGDHDIYGARVSTGGTVLDPSGIAISTAASMQFYPAVAFDGTNFLVVWYDYRSLSDHDIYGARVSTGGTVLDPAGIAICTAANGQARPAIAFDGTNYLVVWDDPRSGSSEDIYGARVSTGGTVLDPAGIAISVAANMEESPAIAFDGTNYLVVWNYFPSGSNLPDVYGARVSTGGVVLDPSGIVISAASMGQWYPAVAFDGTNYRVVWGDSRAGGYSTYGARVSVGGSVLDLDGVAISTSAAAAPCVIQGSGGRVLVGYVSWLTAQHREQVWGSFWGEYVGIEKEEVPIASGVCQSYPNPFNPICTIRYDIANADRASLRVFDVTGSVIRTLVDAWREPGVYREVWDGRRDDGTALPSGVYFYRLEAGRFVATKKMVLLK